MWKLVVAAMFFTFGASEAGVLRSARGIREGAASSAYSSSSSSAGAGSNVFHFPTAVPMVRTMMNPAFGFNNAFQQFIETANAANIAATQDPIFAKIYQQQMAILANMQQMAMIQYPFAFPGFEIPNTVVPGVATWNTIPEAGLGTRTGHEPAVFTSGSVSYGTPGGVGVVSSFPGGMDGLGVRGAEEFPAPIGNGPIGTFSSSSSGVSNVNGETTSFKTSTIGVNDNGRISFRTVTE